MFEPLTTEPHYYKKQSSARPGNHFMEKCRQRPGLGIGGGRDRKQRAFIRGPPEGLLPPWLYRPACTHLTWCSSGWHWLWYCWSQVRSWVGATTSKGWQGLPSDACSGESSVPPAQQTFQRKRCGVGGGVCVCVYHPQKHGSSAVPWTYQSTLSLQQDVQQALGRRGDMIMQTRPPS